MDCSITMLRLNDTIAAIATPPGEGGIGIVRLSGPDSFPIADRLFHTVGAKPSGLPTHMLRYGRITETGSDDTVDDAVILLYRAPHSYTGEDVVEFSCHGGPITLGRVMGLCLHEGARAAEPGEFTQRAFLNGRMDLAQAEAVCDQIKAKTEAAQRLALRQREGALSREVQRIRNELVGAMAAVEVTIDFSEEVGDLDYPAMLTRLRGIREDIEVLIQSAEQGRVYREGIRLAIIGRPNVGKSSLLNALVGHDRAIVTPIPGTTRDTVEETANIRGIPITAIDTAGLRETEDPVERIGVDRARAAADSADLILRVVDNLSDESDRSVGSDRSDGVRVIHVLNKRDLLTPAELSKLSQRLTPNALPVSALTGEGLEELRDAIADSVLHNHSSENSVLVSNIRHQHALESARESLIHAESTTDNGLPPDFISIDLRAALDSLGQITGETATEEIIHRIFHDFCVGK